MSKDFDKVFTDAIEQIEADAKEVGLTLTAICRETKIGRSTPDRWKRTPPKTIKLIKEMQGVIARRRAELAQAASA